MDISTFSLSRTSQESDDDVTPGYTHGCNGKGCGLILHIELGMDRKKGVVGVLNIPRYTKRLNPAGTCV
jgi:hypothetical protein